MEQLLHNSGLSVSPKQWLKQCLREMRLQCGTYRLADRELARRAGLHVEEARRWLYGDYLPRATSREKFLRLLVAVGAREEEINSIMLQVGLGTPPASSHCVGDEATPSAFEVAHHLLFNLESPKTGRWEISEWAGLRNYHTILEDGRREVRCPALSVDGRLLVTVKERPSGGRHLEIVDDDGRRRSRRHRLPLQYAGHGSWSPDGMAICCQVSNDLTFRLQAIVRFEIASERSLNLTAGEYDDTGPEWRPDGEYVVFQRDGDLWAVDAEGRKSWQVLNRQRRGGYRRSAPAFSPNGQRLAYVRQQDRFCAELCCLDLRTNTVATLLTTPGVAYRDPCWSPDGEHLLISTNRATGHNFELWLVGADGGNLQQMTAYEGNIRKPVWQPRRSVKHAPHLLRLF